MIRNVLRRWRTASKLRRGRCEWCDAVLPDTGSVDDIYRVCSEDCRSEVELYRMV